MKKYWYVIVLVAFIVLMSSCVIQIPFPPEPPSNLEAEALSSTEIKLTWQDNSTNEEGFEIERKTEVEEWSQIKTVEANITEYTDSGLSTDTTYYYRIRSYNIKGYSNYSNTATVTTTKSEPINGFGKDSYITIISGNLSGQDITATNLEITVAPSEQLSGNFEISVNNTGPSNDIFPIVATPNWGDHETSYWCVASHQSPGIKTHTVNVDLTAPSTPGTYYLIIAACWEMSCANIASGTNWTVGENHWNDGNDLAEWDVALIEEATEKGIVIAEWELPNGMVEAYVPASAIKVHVSEGESHTGWQHPGYDLSNTRYYPYPSQIETNEFAVVWSSPTVDKLLVGDLNGDSAFEIVSAYENEVSAMDKEGNELWIRNVESDSGISSAKIHSMDLADMDNDGDTEVVVGISPAVPYPGVNKPLRILFYDDEGNLMKSISLPDSHVIDVKCADLDSDGEVEVIAAIYAWYTLKPRGIYVYEYSTGNELWHYDVGPQISIDAIADINNDGYKEIIIGDSAPHNGNSDNGTDDSHSYVFCFDKDGNNLWTKQIGYCAVRSSVADLDNDGTVEIISFHFQNHYYPNTNYVHILEPSSGGILHTYEGPDTKVWRGWALADINNDNKKEIVVGNEDGKIRVLDYNLNLLLSGSFEGAVQAINDINGDGKEEIIFCTEDDKIMILDNELNQLWSSEGANSAIISDLIPGGTNEIVAVGDELKVISGM